MKIVFELEVKAPPQGASFHLLRASQAQRGIYRTERRMEDEQTDDRRTEGGLMKDGNKGRGMS